MRMLATLSPLPQLFPRLDELLNLPCAREMIAGNPASQITTLIEIPHGAAGEMRQPMTQVFQVLPAQNFFRDLRTPGHDEGILACSLFVRLRFGRPLPLSFRISSPVIPTGAKRSGGTLRVAGGWPTFTFFVKVGIHAAFAGTFSLCPTALLDYYGTPFPRSLICVSKEKL